MSSRSELERLQNKRLKSIVKHAAENSAYYRGLLDNANIDPRKVSTIADLSTLPITSKSALLSNNNEIQNNIAGQKAFLSETSGSSGFPLVFTRNQYWDATHNASVMRGYAWHGVNAWDRNGYLWGYNISGTAKVKTKLLDFIQNRFRIFSYSKKEMDVFCRKLGKAKYIGGYSSMIHELSKYIIDNPILKNQINLKMVKGTSEKIFESYQVNAEQAFGKRMISEYGAAEAGIIAFECPNGNMHINMENCIVEVVDNEIVVTNLVSHSFPIIRYSLGDYVEVDNQTLCDCGRQSSTIKSVTGRVGAKIQGNVHAYPSLIIYYIFKNLAVNHHIELNYQAVQRRRGSLEFRLERILSSNEKLYLSTEFKKYFKNDMELSISDNERLFTGDSKTKDFVSLL